MPEDPSRPITMLLQRWRQGDEDAPAELAPLVYQELRRIAQDQMRREGPRTMQATELVHEAYLRLFHADPVDWQDRKHFFAVASRQIRHLLVDAARRRNAEKRGGEFLHVDLTEAIPANSQRQDDLLAVHEALEVLAGLDPQCVQVVELRLFGGLSEKEAAEFLGVSPAKARRDWDFARAWLLNRLRS